MNKVNKIAIGIMIASSLLPSLSFAEVSSNTDATSTSVTTSVQSRKDCLASVAKTHLTSNEAARTALTSSKTGAMTTRNSAIANAKTTLTNAKSTAMTTRDAALVTAKALTDKVARAAAIKSAWSDYSTAVKSANVDYSNTKKSVLSDYSTAIKTAKDTYNASIKSATDQAKADKLSCPKK